jgi:hypothetical protein
VELNDIAESCQQAGNKHVNTVVDKLLIFTPSLSCSPRGVFANLRVTFKLLFWDSDTTSVMGGFFLSSATNVFNFSIRKFNFCQVYRKPPTISPGLIYFRKRFLMGLYKGGGGGLYMDDLLC